MTDQIEAAQQKTGLSADYDASAAAYEAHWAPALAELASNFVATLDLSGAPMILDVGAGSGSMLRHLLDTTDAAIFGIDRSLGMLARGPSSAPRAVMDAEQLGFIEAAFDVALAMFVLFHLPDPQAGIQELRRVLRAGGTFAFTTWGDDDPDFRAFDVFDEVLDRHGAAEGRGLYSCYDPIETPEKCAAALEQGGFEVQSVRTERMAHEWTVEHLIGFRTGVGFGRVRWESLDAESKSAVLEEGRVELAQLTPGEMILRDQVIYAVGKAVR
jgi:SAM-dependent methyltransferase